MTNVVKFPTKGRAASTSGRSVSEVASSWKAVCLWGGKPATRGFSVIAMSVAVLTTVWLAKRA